MTNEQRNQVAAMNASGMSIDEIVLDTKLDRKEVGDFVAERNKKNGKRAVITPELKQAVIEWYQSGHSEHQTGRKFGIAQSTVHRILAKEKEPTPAATEVSSEVSSKNDTNSSVQVQDNTSSAESQALEAARKKLLAIYETLSPEETRAWELGEVYAEVVRGLGE